MSNKLTWEQLDACRTADEVAALLRANGIKGVPALKWECPLARATGTRVSTDWRRLGRWKEPLTQAEHEFVLGFDGDEGGCEYPDLIADE